MIGTERCTTFLINIQGSKCNAVIDTGSTRSCISEAYFKTLLQQNLKGLHRVAVRSASGSSLAPVGFMTCNITLGNKTFQHDFIVFKHLMRPLILGREFLYENELKVYYSKTGESRLDHKEEELIATVDMQDKLTLTLKGGAYIPGRTVAVAKSLFLVMQTAFLLQTAFSCFYAGCSLPCLLVFSFPRVQSLRLFLGNVCERLSRSLLGSYVHQESI